MINVNSIDREYIKNMHPGIGVELEDKIGAECHTEKGGTMTNVMFDSKSSADQYFLTTASIIASQYNCEIEDIDLDNCVVFLKGPDDKQVDCCRALINALENFLR